MFKKGMRILLAAAAVAPILVSTAWAAGQMTIIVNDPSNPYWLTEGNVAKATAEKLGYKNVKHLSAGKSGWEKAGEKLVAAK